MIFPKTIFVSLILLAIWGAKNISWKCFSKSRYHNIWCKLYFVWQARYYSFKSARSRGWSQWISGKLYWCPQHWQVILFHNFCVEIIIVLNYFELFDFTWLCFRLRKDYVRPVLLTFKDPDKEELVSTEKATFFACRKVFVASLLRIWISLSLCQNIFVKKIIEATISYKIRIWTHVINEIWLVNFGMKVMKLNTWYDCTIETIFDTFPQQASLYGCVIETPFGDFGKKKMIE